MVNGRIDERAEISQYAVLQDQRRNATPLRQGARGPLDCRIPDDERRRLRRVEPALEHARNKQPVGQMSVEEIPEKRTADKQIAQCFFASLYCYIREMAFNETTCRSQFRCGGHEFIVGKVVERDIRTPDFLKRLAAGERTFHQKAQRVWEIGLVKQANIRERTRGRIEPDIVVAPLLLFSAEHVAAVKRINPLQQLVQFHAERRG